MTVINTLIKEHEKNKEDIVENMNRIKEISINVKDFGAIGDWDGSNGTDNLTAFNNAIDALPNNGGNILIENGDFWMSDTFQIRKSNVTVTISPNATVRTTKPTTVGSTIGFRGSNDYLTQISNVKMVGGGKVVNSSTGDNENGIFLSACKGATIEGMNLPVINRKAITAQHNCSALLIKGNRIGTTGNDAITIETNCSDSIIADNIIENSNSKGITISTESTGTIDNDNITIRNNTIIKSNGDGIYVGSCHTSQTENNTLMSIGGRGIVVNLCDVFTSTNDKIINTKMNGLYFSRINKYFSIDKTYIENPSIDNSNMYDAISIANSIIPFTFTNCIIKGVTHKYAINISTSEGNSGIFKNNTFDKGVSDVDYKYQGWTPFMIDDNFGGKTYKMENRGIKSIYGNSAPTTLTWGVGDKVINTTPSLNGYTGWICVTSGTPGIWKGYGLIQS